MIQIQQITSARFNIENAHTLKVAKQHGAYSCLSKVFQTKPTDLITIIENSGLRGKGGGGAFTGKKWRLIPSPCNRPIHLVVNADESEPGTFKDREILQKDPHMLIEGIIASSFAIGAHSSYIYIRGEYKFPHDRMQEAINEAYDAAFLGKNILGSGFDLELTLYRGAGAYICGEKSALIESLEGKRGYPRLKPHKPEPEFFFGNPTIVNNVETIASTAYIFKQGSNAYRKFGTKQNPGTMLFSMSGHINNPGVYELAFGENMLDVINDIGGGVKNNKKLKAVIPGGTSTQVMNLDQVKKATLDYETLRSLQTSLGTGGMIIMDEDTCMVKILYNLLKFYHHESCGQCTPCREGTGWVKKIMYDILHKVGKSKDIDTLMDISELLNGKTVCVLAPSVSGIIDSFMKNFYSEFKAFIKDDV